MTERTTTLLRLLDELAEILHQRDNAPWERWVRKDIALISVGDLYGIRHFLSAFGGPGSMNDLFMFGTHEWKLLNEAHRIALELERESKLL